MAANCQERLASSILAERILFGTALFHCNNNGAMGATMLHTRHAELQAHVHGNAWKTSTAVTWTQAFRVTGGNTNHYTTTELKQLDSPACSQTHYQEHWVLILVWILILIVDFDFVWDFWFWCWFEIGLFWYGLVYSAFCLFLCICWSGFASYFALNFRFRCWISMGLAYLCVFRIVVCRCWIAFWFRFWFICWCLTWIMIRIWV